MNNQDCITASAPRKSRYAEYFAWKHQLELNAWATHPNPVELLEAAYEETLEALEERDWGAYPENMDMTIANFKVKFNRLTGRAAYELCLSTIDTYKQR